MENYILTLRQGIKRRYYCIENFPLISWKDASLILNFGSTDTPDKLYMMNETGKIFLSKSKTAGMSNLQWWPYIYSSVKHGLIKIPINTVINNMVEHF